MRRLTLLTIFIFLSVSCKKQETTTSSTQGGGTPSFTGSCSVGRWPASRRPITLKISSDLSSDMTPGQYVSGLSPLEQMAKVWNDSISGNIFFNVPFSAAANTGYSDLDSFQDGQMGIYRSDSWFSDVSSGALAITQYYGYMRSSSTLGSYVELSEADIIINNRNFNGDFYFDAIPYSQDGIYKWDLPTVVLHEMGHFLGMCHDSGHSSVMKPYYGKTRKTLYSFDITKITDLYVNNVNTLAGYSNLNAVTAADGTFVRGRTELMKTGECIHYINGKEVYRHK